MMFPYNKRISITFYNTDVWDILHKRQVIINCMALVIGFKRGFFCLLDDSILSCGLSGNDRDVLECQTRAKVLYIRADTDSSRISEFHIFPLHLFLLLLAFGC